MRWLLLSLALVVADAQSQPPVHEVSKKDGNQPTKSSNEKTATDKSPSQPLPSLPIQRVAADKNDPPKGDGSKNHKWYDTFLDHTTEWLLVLFNGLLALYTWRLFKATHGLREAAEEQSRDMKSSINVARDAAKAAQDSANAANRSATVAEKSLVITQRADLHPLSYVALAIRDDTQEIAEWQFTIFFQNSGATKAIHAIPSSGILVGEEPAGEFGLPHLIQDRVRISIGARQQIAAVASPKLTHEQIQEIAKDKLNAYLVGYIEYNDVFDSTPVRHTAVCMKIAVVDMNPTGQDSFRFVARGKNNYTD